MKRYRVQILLDAECRVITASAESYAVDGSRTGCVVIPVIGPAGFDLMSWLGLELVELLASVQVQPELPGFAES